MSDDWVPMTVLEGPKNWVKAGACDVIIITWIHIRPEISFSAGGLKYSFNGFTD